MPAICPLQSFSRWRQRNLRLDAGRKQLAAKLAKIKAGEGAGKGGGDSGEYGISWGFDEDAIAEEEDEDGDGAEGDEDEVGDSLLILRVLYNVICIETRLAATRLSLLLIKSSRQRGTFVWSDATHTSSLQHQERLRVRYFLREHHGMMNC